MKVDRNCFAIRSPVYWTASWSASVVARNPADATSAQDHATASTPRPERERW